MTLQWSLTWTDAATKFPAAEIGLGVCWGVKAEVDKSRAQVSGTSRFHFRAVSFYLELPS